ncbi:MAG: hypothetical protein KDE31_23580 [Caldilineaceae bacterium]|nr:hypothetical protein [Caldilineaceae bacterium]
MTQARPFSIAVEEDEFVIRADRTLFDMEELTQFLEYLRIRSLRSRSQASQPEIDELARSVNKKVWQQLKHRVLPDL